MKSPIRPVKKNGRFNLFFMEMIIVLLFFSIAAAIILRSFAASDRLARESRRLENMTFCAQSAAEIYSRTASISETAERLFGNGLGGVFITDGLSRIAIPLDSECRYSPSSSELTIILTEDSEGYGDGSELMKLKIIFTDSSGEIVFNMETGVYVSERERSVSGIE